MRATVVFCAGDDLLFRGFWNQKTVKELQQTYSRHTQGRTCSIGFGSTTADAQHALRLAKGHQPKGRIIGILQDGMWDG